MTLSELSKYETANISELPTDFDLSTQLIEQGFALKTIVSLAHKAPFNGPLAFYLHGTKICLPREVANQIKVELVN